MGDTDITLWGLVLESGLSLAVGLAYFALIMTVAFVVGRAAERRHLRRIEAAEALFGALPVVSLGKGEMQPGEARVLGLVSGGVVVANDLFKAWRARVRSLFGGNITHFETLVERARRDAVARMRREAAQLGASQVCGVRFEATAISTGRGGGVEVLAYGTALG